ncbi:MAG: agmatinase [candidate division WOR-3 bacterium]
MGFEFTNSSLKDAQVVILGIPFDRTSSYMGGCRFAPQFIRIGGENIEAYSPYFNEHITKYAIHDAGDVLLDYSTVKQTFNQIRRKIRKYLQAKKKLLILGGEHTITIPIIQEFLRFYPNLYIIQLDAHSDTRDTFLGEKFCHATVIKRISEMVSTERIIQLGLRSLTVSPQNPNQFLFTVLEPIYKIKDIIKESPCYLTLDIDVIDCGLFPAVQTPVPGGIDYKELFNAIYEFRKINIVGCDLVEYSPLVMPNLNYASVAAEITRELLLLLCHKLSL